MSFFHASAGKAEVVRTVQKDTTLTDQLTNSYSSILQVTGNRNWIQYNKLCKIIAELSYHGFAAINNLQTLGEEYTGVIQVDSNYITLPHKLIQLLTIFLEFGGEELLYKILRLLEHEIRNNDDILPRAQEKLLYTIKVSRAVVPYIKAFHRSIFYIKGGKYQISKRVTGINYVLVRHWLKDNQSVYGYKILGFLNLIQIVLSIFTNIRQQIVESRNQMQLKSLPGSLKAQTTLNQCTRTCVLCLEFIEVPSVTKCGHLFCWNCIIDWMGQKSECPVCREPLKKIHTIVLRNY